MLRTAQPCDPISSHRNQSRTMAAHQHAPSLPVHNAIPPSRRGRPPPMGYFPSSPTRQIQAIPPTSTHTFYLNASTSEPSNHATTTSEVSPDHGVAQYEAALQGSTRSSTPTASGYTHQRRGIRGSRAGRGNVKIKVEPDTAALLPIGNHVETPTSRNRGGRPRENGRGGRLRTGRGSRGGRTGRAVGVKRTRGDLSDGDDGDQGSSSGEEMIALPPTSRSGRRITQASNYSPVVIDLDDLDAQATASSGVKNRAIGADLLSNRDGRGGRRTSRLPKRKPGEAAVCRNCGRGYSPVGNMIVFCDGCNMPWHQSCHDPPISGEVIRVEESQWFCGDCIVKKDQKPMWDRRVDMGSLSLVEQRYYLSTLPPEELISLLLQATTLHPDLPIFTPPMDEEEVGYLQERELLPYPRPGNGVKLPPETNDVSMLVDDNIVAFSHCYGWTERDLFGTESLNGHSDSVTMGSMGMGSIA